jgi:predicted enzyme related to lactoylglutathione lyase
MSDFHGRFCWYELMTSDREAAKPFYGSVVGWGSQEVPSAGIPYSLFTAPGGPVAGLMDLPGPTAPLAWLGYVAVDDVDATAAQATGLGATIRMPPTDIPGIGRFAVFSDPQGATVALFHPVPGSTQPAAMEAPGGIGWHELQAADWPSAFAFYRELFGWEKAEAMDTGEMGVYQLFEAGGTTIGGMFTKPPVEVGPFWLFYFNVGDIDAATARVTAGGGEVVTPAMPVPGGGWIIHAKDPQGALFALHGTRA